MNENEKKLIEPKKHITNMINKNSTKYKNILCSLN